MVQEEDEITITARANVNAETGTVEKTPFLVVLTGNSAGRSWKVESLTCVIGRGADADFLLDDEGISRKHARVHYGADGKLSVRDLNSTNGTFVNEERVETHPLEDGDKIRLGSGTVIRFAYEDHVETNVRDHLFTSATHDPLTGVQNKRAFDDHLQRSIAYSRRHKAPLSLIIFDVDHFKSVNDNHGHPVGDEVLKEVARRVMEAIRLEDTFCRIGGEEFAVLLPGLDLDHGCLAADRIRTVISRDAFETEAGELDISISAGVALFDVVDHPNGDALVASSDEKLYQAKHEGRNCVRPEPPRRRRVFRDLNTVVNDSEIQKYVAVAKQRRGE